MGRTAESLLSEALELSDEERLKFASELLASVDGPADPDWDSSWLQELDRRTREAGGREQPAPAWSEVRAEVFQRLTRR